MHDVQNGLPTSIRHVKNGRSGRWWKSAQKNGQIHAGWKSIPDELLRDKDLLAIEKLLKAQYGDKQGARQDYNQLRYLLDSPNLFSQLHRKTLFELRGGKPFRLDWRRTEAFREVRPAPSCPAHNNRAEPS